MCLLYSKAERGANVRHSRGSHSFLFAMARASPSTLFFGFDAECAREDRGTQRFQKPPEPNLNRDEPLSFYGENQI